MRSRVEGVCSGAGCRPLRLAALATSPASQGKITLVALPPNERKG
jgi:hypothetical protein